jgi:hypothetical protein
MGTLTIDYDLSLVKIQPAHNIQMLLQMLPVVTEATAAVHDEPGESGFEANPCAHFKCPRVGGQSNTLTPATLKLC